MNIHEKEELAAMIPVPLVVEPLSPTPNEADASSKIATVASADLGITQEEAQAFYRKALYDADKAIDDMMQRHEEIVAEGQKRMKAYAQKRALEKRVQKAQEEREALAEKALVERLNHRELLEEARRKDELKK